MCWLLLAAYSSGFFSAHVLGWVTQGIILVCTEEQEEQYKPHFTVEEAAESLPDGVLRVSPFVRLDCQDQQVPFEPRIRLYLPACSLADSAWRSTEDGWEEIEWKPAGDGYALLKLDHFCDVFVGTARDARCLTSRLYLADENDMEKTLRVAFEKHDCLHCREVISKWLPSHRLSLEAGCQTVVFALCDHIIICVGPAFV